MLALKETEANVRKLKLTRQVVSARGTFNAGQEFRISDTLIAPDVVDEKTARIWLEGNAAVVMKPEPEANKMAPGPSENKTGNSFGAPTAGRSTDSPSSSAPGPEQQSFALPGGNPRAPTSTRSRRGGGKEGGGTSSQ